MAKKPPTELKDRKVYVQKRDGGGVDIVWRIGGEIHRVYRKSAEVGAAFGLKVQRELDAGHADPSFNFGDTVQGMDGGESGRPARELLWSAAVTIAQNPGPGAKNLREAGRAVAVVLSTLRRFMPADMLVVGDSGEDDVNDAAFWNQAVPFAKQWMDSIGVPDDQKQVVLQVLQGGRAS
jgi:hypothetical protein